jgi:hypothetical protein
VGTPGQEAEVQPEFASLAVAPRRNENLPRTAGVREVQQNYWAVVQSVVRLAVNQNDERSSRSCPAKFQNIGNIA